MAYLLPQTIVIQEFTTAQGASAAPHSAVVVGAAYELHRYTDSDEKAGTSIGAYAAATLTAPYPGMAVSSVADLEYSKVFMEDAVLEVGSNPSVVNGTFVISGSNLIITALTGSFFQGPTLPAGLNGRSVIPGDTLKLIDYTTPANVEYVTVRTAVLGVVTVTTPIDSAWIAGLTSGRFDIEVQVVDDVEIAERQIGNEVVANWTVDATGVTIAAAITAVPSAVYNGTLPLTVASAAATFLHYRARRGTLGTAPIGTSIEDVAGDFGPISTDNPIAYGVYKALLNSGAVQVYGICPVDDQLESWTETLGRLDALTDAYVITPLTNEVELQDACKAHIDFNSDGHTWRIGIFGTSIPEYTAKVTPANSTLDTVTVVNPTTVSIVLAGSDFLINGVVPGDFVKTIYAPGGGQDDVITYRLITTVISNNEIQALGIPTDYTTVGTTWTVVKRNTSADNVANIVANAGHFSSRRIYLVWPDVATSSDGEEVAGYYLAAAIAGLRSTSLPHQGLTNITINGFLDVKRTTEAFTGSQLNTMAEGGVWIVTKDIVTGEIYTRHQLSTDPTDLNTREQNITTNVDDISYRIYNAAYKLVGVGNVTPTMLRIINDTVNYVLTSLEGAVSNERLGPQLLEGTIISIAVDPVFADKVNVKVGLDIPEPLNVLEITLTI